MTQLLIPGHFPETFFPGGYWDQNYWQHFQIVYPLHVKAGESRPRHVGLLETRLARGALGEATVTDVKSSET